MYNGLAVVIDVHRNNPKNRQTAGNGKKGSKAKPGRQNRKNPDRSDSSNPHSNSKVEDEQPIKKKRKVTA